MPQRNKGEQKGFVLLYTVTIDFILHRHFVNVSLTSMVN